jgi:hypothetical protein
MSNETPNQTVPGNDHLKQLLVALERRTEGQSEMLHLIAESLQGIESHLRQIALSSNPAPNYQRPLSEYHGFDLERNALQHLRLGSPEESNRPGRSHQTSHDE